MKTNCWLILGTMLATTAVAQVNTNRLPPIPPPAIPAPIEPAPAYAPVATPANTTTNAPIKKVTHARKKIVKKAKTSTRAKTTEKKTPAAPVVLVPGPATVDAEHVNLRGQAGLKGEVVGHAKKGDPITIISEITLDKPKAGEPAQWAKIALPSSTKVWVDAKYVDASNNVVTAKKLNLRGGPGENFSVLGVIEKGASITQVTTKDGWMQIEPPTSAFAFVAASYLKQEGFMVDTNVPTTVATTETPTAPVVPPTPPPTPTTVTETPTIAPPATTPPPVAETTATPTPATQAPENVPPPTLTPTPAVTLPPPTLAEEDTNLPPPPPRIVTHEGTVRHSVSPVAPTDFELFDPADNKAINYLYSSTTNLVMSRYNGLHITATGEEGLDPRWKDTPIITIQKIYVLSGDAPVMKPVKKHWWSK